MDFFEGAGVAQRMRCAPRRDKSRLNRSLNLSFGWSRRSIPPPTAQFIAVVSLTNSGTVPEFFPEFFKGQSLGFFKGQSLGFLTERIKIIRSHPRHHDDALLDRFCVQGAPSAASRRLPR